MKILHIALSDGGGAGMGMMNLHYALLQQGVDSRVLVANKTTDDATVQVAKPNQYLWPAIPIIRFLEKVARRFGLCFNRYDRIHHDIYKVRKKHFVPFSSPVTPYDLSVHPLVKEADVINLHYVSDFVDVESFFAKVTKPIVWTLRDENPGLGGFHYRTTKQYYGSYFAPIEEAFLAIKRKAITGNKSIRLVSLSKGMRSFCAEIDFLQSLPNVVIYNPISPDTFMPYSRSEVRKALGLSEQDVLLLFISCSLGERRKRLAETIEALSLTVHKHIKLLCVGRMDFETDSPQVVLLGSIADPQKLSALYAAANAFVSPSVQESFGKTIVEALYCGTPVVSTPVGIAAEIVNDTNGALCGEGTPLEIAQAIDKVLDTSYDPVGIRKQMVSLFSPVKVANQYVALYQTCMSDEQMS